MNDNNHLHCFSFCTAAAYNIKPFFEYIRTLYKATLYRDFVHVEFPKNSLTSLQDASSTHVVVEGFFFSYGTAAFWGATREECLQLLLTVKSFEKQPFEELEIDEFSYIYNDMAKILDDEITLPDRQPLTKLALSYAIIQSVKLSIFETSALKTFDKNKYLPEDLAKFGKISLSRSDIRRKMGELFIERSSINLHLDVLATPEFFWEYPELEPLYKIMFNYLDIGARVDALNQRLDVLHELLDMLGNELNHQHSSRLEWTIIVLIVLEVLMSLAKDVFKII